MAKMTRQERAWQNLVRAMNGEKRKRSGSPRRRGAKGAKWDGYEALHAVAEGFGCRVLMMTQEEIEREFKDAQGNSFNASGFFQAPRTIKLRAPSFAVLAHELAHALDHQLGGQSHLALETVAVAVEHLLVVDLYGNARSCATGIAYARRNFGTPATLEASRERIEVIYELIREALDNIPRGE